MCASEAELKRAVESLKQQLLVGEPEKKRTTLKQLENLKISVQILLETKIGRLVNSFRHDPLLGPLAKRVVAKWKEDAYESARASGIVIEESTDAKSLATTVDGKDLDKGAGHFDGVEPLFPGSKHQEICDTVSASNKSDRLGDVDHEQCASDGNRHSVDGNAKPSSRQSSGKKPHEKAKKNGVRKAPATSIKFTPELSSFEDALLSADGATFQHRHKKLAKPHRKSSGASSSSKKAVTDDGRPSKPQASAAETAKAGVSAFDVDLSKILSKTIPDYHPLRSDVPDLPERTQKRTASSSDYLDAMLFKTKNARTQVYSGRRTLFLSSVPSLFDSCLRVLSDNIDALGYTGGVPFSILKPVLQKASAVQLYRIEELNPYLLEDTEPLWQEHCNRDFRDANPDLDSGETFRELYERKVEEREKKFQDLAATISANRAAQGPIRQVKLADAKAPREVRRRQRKYGTAVKHLPTTEDILETRRRGVTDLKSTGRAGVRSGTYDSLDSACSKKTAVTKAPLMLKTLKMIKKCRAGRY